MVFLTQTKRCGTSAADDRTALLLPHGNIVKWQQIQQRDVFRFPIANSVRRAGGKANLGSTFNAVYTAARSNYTGAMHDVATGSNGSCGTVCNAGSGYDYVTGLGSPQANVLIPAFDSLP